MLASVSRRYPEPKGRFPRVTHPCATRAEALVRLACVRHAASVRSEPGSNSQVQDEQTRKVRSLDRVATDLTQAFETVVSYCLTEMLKRPAMPIPLPENQARDQRLNTAACASLLTTRYPLCQRTRGPKDRCAAASGTLGRVRRGEALI